MPAARPHDQRRDLPSSAGTACRRDWRTRCCDRTASRRLIWPCTTLSQVGVSESSQSAMNTFAPEFSALMIILRSVGPVISTRRSCRSAGIARHSPLPFANSTSLGEKIRQRAGIELALAGRASLEQSDDAIAEAAGQVGDELQRGRRKNGLVARLHRAPNGGRPGSGPLPDWSPSSSPHYGRRSLRSTQVANLSGFPPEGKIYRELASDI